MSSFNFDYSIFDEKKEGAVEPSTAEKYFPSIYKQFDEVSGISFLPFSEHTYKQAPYQDCTVEEYGDMLKKMPKAIDWTWLQDYEKEDTTSGGRELACTADACEVVDLNAA